MTDIRPFLNYDPPEIVRLWRSQADRHRFANSLSHALFESMVLSKPFFDPEGLIVAEREGQLIGFIHAGFAPRRDWMDLELADGVICLLLIDPGAFPEGDASASDSEDSAERVMERLLNEAETYLRKRGTQRVFFGSRFPEGPFYLGLFGGSQIPGLLVDQQSELIAFLRKRGYGDSERIHIFQRRLGNFRAVIDRRQVQIRRNFQLQEELDPQPHTWWESCTLGDTDRTRFTLIDCKTHEPCGNVTYWDIQPLSRDWGIRTMGLYDLKINAGIRQSGLATFLVGESIRYLQKWGISMVEAQVRESNDPAMRLFRKYGFEDVDAGISLVKQLDGTGPN